MSNYKTGGIALHNNFNSTINKKNAQPRPQPQQQQQHQQNDYVNNLKSSEKKNVIIQN
jgi:hypothetical protein